MQLLAFALTLEFTHMYKSLCKLPEPLVDALLYQGRRQPEWSDDYYQQLLMRTLNGCIVLMHFIVNNTYFHKIYSHMKKKY
jgi:hypothetical protein